MKRTRRHRSNCIRACHGVMPCGYRLLGLFAIGEVQTKATGRIRIILHNFIRIYKKRSHEIYGLEGTQKFRLQLDFTGQRRLDQFKGDGLVFGHPGPDRQIIGSMVGVEQSSGQIGMFNHDL